MNNVFLLHVDNKTESQVMAKYQLIEFHPLSNNLVQDIAQKFGSCFFKASVKHVTPA